MRIGVNCFMLQPHMGGIAHYFLYLFRELLTAEHGHEYVFFWYAHNEAMLARLGSERWREGAVLLHDQLEVRAHLDRIDLYFCPLSVLYPRPLPRPTVVTLPDIQERYYPEFFAAQDLYTRDLHFAASTRMADRVVTHSRFSRDCLVRHHGLPVGKVVVAHHTVDRRYFEAERVARRPASALPEAFAYYPANLWKHKNHESLLQALRWLAAERGLRVPLVLTGFPDEGPGAYPLRRRAEELGVADQVLHLGLLEVEEVAWLYRQARLLVFPSLFEGFGMPLVEAMATGCPLAASRSTSVPEVVADAGLLFEPQDPRSIGEAVLRLWSDDALRAELSARGRRRAQAFGAEQAVAAHLRAFEEARRAYSPLRHWWLDRVYQRYYAWRVERRWRGRLNAS